MSDPNTSDSNKKTVAGWAQIRVQNRVSGRGRQIIRDEVTGKWEKGHKFKSFNISDRQFVHALVKHDLIPIEQARAFVKTGTLPPAFQSAIDHPDFKPPKNMTREDVLLALEGESTFATWTSGRGQPDQGDGLDARTGRRDLAHGDFALNLKTQHGDQSNARNHSNSMLRDEATARSTSTPTRSRSCC